jgi:trigger factor
VTSSPPSQSEFKNDEIHVKVHRKAACKVELDVHVNAALIQKARLKALKQVGREVSLPGFRKGKAPKELVLKKFGPQIDKEQEIQLADLAYNEAQKLTNISLLNHNTKISFHTKKQSPEEAELSFTFETEPRIPSIEVSGFEPKQVDRPEIAEKQVEEAIRQMRYFYAEWRPVEHRGVQDGDTIMIHLDVIEDGVPRRVFDHVRFEVSKERMADWMKTLVEGAKVGDVLQGVSTPDETTTDEEKKEFNPKNVQVTILKLEEAILPELNDEFSKKVGAPTVEAMRQSILHLLNKQADENVQEELRKQVNEYLVDKFPFELPHSLIETEKKYRLQHLQQSPQFQENWEKMNADEKKVFERNLLDEVDQSIRLFYLSRKIVNDAKLSITHKEVQDEAIAILRAAGQGRIEKIPKETYALALSKVILAKAQDHILAQKK